jgi:Holliday junction resolvasome RuvABC endonuclease subunit
MVVNLLELDHLPKYTDVTDALGLAIAHSYIMRSAASLKTKRRSLKALRKRKVYRK